MVELNKNNEKININEIKLKTLANIPIKITKTITVYPLTLKEITMLGYNIYNQSLNYVCIDLKDIDNKSEDFSNISMLDFIINSCIQDINFRTMFLNSLSLFLRNQIFFYNNMLYVSTISEETKITNSLFDSIQIIIKIQNSIERKKEDIYNVKSKKGKEILEKLKKGKKKLDKLNPNKLTLFDLISIYCSYNNNTNLLDVWNYNMFQFNDQFQRIQILEQYDVNIQALLHGAKMEDESPTFIKKIN